MTAPGIESLFEQLEQSLKGASPILAKDRGVYIYGAGNVGKEICRILRRHNVEPAAFLDRKAKPDSEWEQVAILPPDTSRISPRVRHDAQVIVGVFNRDADPGEIRSLLGTLGYGRVVSFLEFHSEFHAELGDRYWLTSREYYPNEKQAIARTDHLWSDDASRGLYRAILQFRFTMRHDALPGISLDDQYFPSDIPPWPSPVRFADCGAYDGDTLRSLVNGQKAIQVEAVAAFEPDLSNFNKLAESLRSGALAHLGFVCLYPCGVGSETATVRFLEGQGEGSRITEAGGTVIQCVTLDSALVGFRPNLIKMDIEGSEVDAVLGARQILRENRPGLALCVYHRPGHLWQIPALIDSLLPGGRHYLRAHAYNAFDLVYYWVP
jgi:FkbM family methyltransferase